MATWLKMLFRGHLLHPQPPTFCGFQPSKLPKRTPTPQSLGPLGCGKLQAQAQTGGCRDCHCFVLLKKNVIRTYLYIFVHIRTFSCIFVLKKKPSPGDLPSPQSFRGTQTEHSTAHIHNCKCLGLFLAEPFLHITVTKHCHSSGPESRAHLLPIFGIDEPCQAEGTLHKCSGRWKPYVWCNCIIYQSATGSPERINIIITLGLFQKW